MGRNNTVKSGQRRTIQIAVEVFDKLKAYSELTGIPMGTAGSRGLDEWLDCSGAVHMEALTGKGLKLPAPRNPEDLPAIPAPPGAGVSALEH